MSLSRHLKFKTMKLYESTSTDRIQIDIRERENSEFEYLSIVDATPATAIKKVREIIDESAEFPRINPLARPTATTIVAKKMVKGKAQKGSRSMVVYGLSAIRVKEIIIEYLTIFSGS